MFAYFYATCYLLQFFLLKNTDSCLVDTHEVKIGFPLKLYSQEITMQML